MTREEIFYYKYSRPKRTYAFTLDFLLLFIHIHLETSYPYTLALVGFVGAFFRLAGCPMPAGCLDHPNKLASSTWRQRRTDGRTAFFIPAHSLEGRKRADFLGLKIGARCRPYLEREKPIRKPYSSSFNLMPSAFSPSGMPLGKSDRNNGRPDPSRDFPPPRLCQLGFGMINRRFHLPLSLPLG